MNSAGSGMSAPANRTERAEFLPLAINPALVERILIGFIQDEVRKVGFQRVVIGLSGGVDSSLAATLAARALGPANVKGLLMGYGTIYGDMASAVNPIGDLYKTQVWQLADALGVPTAIVQKAPSADLWAGQTDEVELGFQYREVDRLLYYLIERRYSLAELEREGFARSFIDVVMGKVRDSQYKRRLPVIAKLSSRTIDRDFRYPRD